MRLTAIGAPRRGSSDDTGGGSGNGSGAGGGLLEEIYRVRRERMVREQIEARGISDPRVLAAMRKVPRHLFVPEDARESAYEDGPVGIGDGQTISQPYIVALMTELLRPKPEDRVLDVGTGSGYQTAVLAEIVSMVHSIEIVEPLARRAASLLEDLGYSNIRLRIGDGSYGWLEAAPFAGILVAAAPGRIPPPLQDQLTMAGRLVIPIGRGDQDLVLVTRTPAGFREEMVTPVRFVPMTGQADTES